MAKRISVEPSKIRISLLKQDSKPVNHSIVNNSVIEEPPLQKHIEQLQIQEGGSDAHQYDLQILSNLISIDVIYLNRNPSIIKRV